MVNKITRQQFLNDMIAFATTKGANKLIATKIMSKYIVHINIEDLIIQHIGPCYYAYQVLIYEHLVPIVAL